MALVAAGLAVLAVPIAGAVGSVESGWWDRANGGGSPPPLPVPGAPTTAPPAEGQLVVGGAPDGATSVAAVRVALSEGEADPVLTLDVVQEVGGTAAVIEACTAATPWSPATGGPFADRPEADCEAASVVGEVAEDRTTVTFALGPLVADGGLDVVLVPGTVEGLPPGANGSSFRLTFEAPGADSFSTSSGGASAGSTPTTAFQVPPSEPVFAPTPEPAPSPEPAPPSEPSPFPAPVPVGADATAPFEPAPEVAVPSSPVVDAPALDPLPPASALDPVAPGAAPALDVGSTEPAESAASVAAGSPGGSGAIQSTPRPVVATSSVRDPRAAGVGLMVVGALLGAGLLLRERLPGAALAAVASTPGTPTDADVRGIGRHARPRSGPVPTL